MPSSRPAALGPLLKSFASNRSTFVASAPPSRYFATPVATRHGGPQGTAIVFLNMGGPTTLPDVGPFLSRLFADADLIPLGRLQAYLGPLISRRRTPKIQAQYAAIGGGSPILAWTRKQAARCCAILDRTSPNTAPHRPYVAFRYADPLTEETYRQLLADGFGGGNGGRAVAFSQYPQYSCSTTGSSLNELWKWRTRLEGKTGSPELGEQNTDATEAPSLGNGQAGSIQWSIIDRWPSHKGLVEAVAQRVEAQLDTYPKEQRDKVLLLFSAHSLPMSVVNRGDPYPAEVAATVYAVMARLGFKNQYRLCWQSQVGPSAWLGAQTSDAVKNYVAKGQKDIVLVPIAFTSDHIETLYELDQEVMEEAGSEGVKRAESLNDSEVFIEALADLAKAHLENGERCSTQLGLRCHDCTSERCREQKKFFTGEEVQL